MKMLRVACLLLASLALAGCDFRSEKWRWNQKLTVEVSTPEGIVSGSAVTEVTWSERNWSGNFPGSYRGEATVVDLGRGRYLFALIGEDTRYLAMRTFAPSGTINEAGFAGIASIRGTREVPVKHYPLLVTFEDMSDPKTVKVVDPGNLAARFGTGFKLRGMSLELGDSPVSNSGLETLLPWLGWTRDEFFAAGDGMNPLNASGEAIARSNFRR